MAKFPLLLAALTLSGLSSLAAAAEGWLDNIDAALAKARESKKPVMVEFTGSDWCPPCIQMEKEVFGKKEFAEKAGAKFILVKIDIPEKDPELRKKNEQVMEKYQVRGVPTVLLLSEDGREFDRFLAGKYPTVEGFLEYLDQALEKKDME